MIEARLMTLRRLARPIAAVVLAASTLVTLQGCAGLVVGTAVVTSLAATDRRTLGAQTEDTSILFKGQSAVNRVTGSAGNVNVTSFNRRVLLTGEVRDEAMKAAVEREIRAVESVQSVLNEVAVMPVSSLSSRSNDTLITGKVKASFVDARDIFANSIKVVTERGVVYLMGRVTEREGQRAADIASRVGGVQKVVKVFEYITEEELQGMTRTSSDRNAKQ